MTRGGPGDRRCRPTSAVIGGATPGVELAQAGGGLDDPGERDLLRRRVRAVSTASAVHRPRRPVRWTSAAPSERAGAVGAGVAEHRLAGEVGSQQAEGGTAPRRRAPTAGGRPHRGRSSGAGDGAEHAPGGGHLERAARAQVEQVEQVGGAGDDRTTDERVDHGGGVRPSRRCGASASAAATSPVSPEPEDLDRPGRHLAAGQRRRGGP